MELVTTWGLVPVFAAVFAIGLLITHAYRRLTNPLNQFPGPAYAKWTNLRLKWAVITGRRMYYIHDLHEKYGPFVRVSPDEISVSDIDAFGQIHRISSGFLKSKWYNDLVPFERLTIFLMVDPKAHSERRRLLARAFSKTYLRTHWESTVRSMVDRAVERMGEDAQKNGTVDVLKWFTFMATDISSHLMFGDSLRMIERGEKNEYIRVLESAMQGGGIGAELPFVRAIGQHIPLQSFQNMFNANDLLMKTAVKALDGAKGNGGTNLFAHILAEAEKGEKLDDLDVQLEASALIVAGSDTTAMTLTYLVWAVLSHPATHAALNNELANIPATSTEQDLEDLPVLNAVIQETLRLYGAAPGSVPRVVPSGGVSWSDGKYFCPGGTTVSTQTYTMHRNADLFSRPYEFDYTRWLSDRTPTDETIAKQIKTVFTPFGAGSRSCLGIHLAQMELRLATFAFFTQYHNARLAPSTTPASMEMENFFLIAPKSHACEIML